MLRLRNRIGSEVASDHEHNYMNLFFLPFITTHISYSNIQTLGWRSSYL
jgi:hypothetical protein